jgi:hypothetical protein
MTRVVVELAVLLAATTSFAQAAVAPNPLPEPGTFELLALGGVVAAVIAFRNRRK